MEPKTTNCKDGIINHSNIYLLFDLIGFIKYFINHTTHVLEGNFNIH